MIFFENLKRRIKISRGEGIVLFANLGYEPDSAYSCMKPREEQFWSF